MLMSSLCLNPFGSTSCLFFVSTLIQKSPVSIDVYKFIVNPDIFMQKILALYYILIRQSRLFD